MSNYVLLCVWNWVRCVYDGYWIFLKFSILEKGDLERCYDLFMMCYGLYKDEVEEFSFWI